MTPTPQAVGGKKITGEELFVRRCARFLQRRGWVVVLCGPICVEQGDRKFKYRLVIDFVGKRKP